MKIFAATVMVLAAGAFNLQIASAQNASQSGGSPTDSPYKNGPPPITGGYTDTSQGGKKTSGDMPVPPPGATSGTDAAIKAGQQPQPPDGENRGDREARTAGRGS